MVGRIAQDGLPRLRRGSGASDGSSRDNKNRGKSGCRQIDEIVEPRRRVPECLIARRAVADHAVSGIDGLVDRAAGQSKSGEPKGGRHDAVGKILRQTLDCRACNPRFIQDPRVPSDDVRHRFSRSGETFLLERVCDATYVIIETALGNQAAGQNCES